MNHDELEKEVEQKYKQRDAKKKPKMKVSGKSVFTLAKISRPGKKFLKLKKS